jgi:hypothetical protein
MNKYLSIILGSILTVCVAKPILGEETIYVEENQPRQTYFLPSSSTQVNYETEEVITQSFYKTIESDQALIYTRGNCEEVNLISSLESLNIDYICRSIDDREKYRELVILLYDIGVGGSIPLPVIYYRQKVLFNPDLEHINVLNPVSLSN